MKAILKLTLQFLIWEVFHDFSGLVFSAIFCIPVVYLGREVPRMDKWSHLICFLCCSSLLLFSKDCISQCVFVVGGSQIVIDDKRFVLMYSR